MRLPSGKIVYSNTPIYPGSNFTWGEATKNCQREIEDLWIDGVLRAKAIDIENNIIKTAQNLDKFRAKLGNYPITINSWYRPAKINRAVNGSKWSRHQYGDAVDWVSKRYSPAQIAKILEPYHNQGGYKAYFRFTHTDWRGTRARW